MAHLLIFIKKGEYNPLTLSINVAFVASGSPGIFIAKAKIEKLEIVLFSLLAHLSRR